MNGRDKLYASEDKTNNKIIRPAGRASPMSGDGVLHENARNLILAGTLPGRPPDRMWGGAGIGAKCVVCGVPVRQDQTGLEIEYTLDGAATNNHHLHVRCYSALEMAFGTAK